MAGIIKKVEQTLGMGGPKRGNKQSVVHKQGYGQRKPVQGYGGGFLNKLKGKIPGVGGRRKKSKIPGVGGKILG